MLEILLVVMVDTLILMLSRSLLAPIKQRLMVMEEMWILVLSNCCHCESCQYFLDLVQMKVDPNQTKADGHGAESGSVEQIYWCPTGLRCHHEDLSCKGLQKFFFSKTVSICKKKCKKSLHRSALLGWDVTRRINVAKMCFLFYFIISNLHHDVIFANMGTVKIKISSLNS